jgi:shikimate dehydrogenase
VKDVPGRLVLLGHPLRHSLSPRFQNAALEQAGVPLRYEALDLYPEELPRQLILLPSQHAAGNVTIPYKVAVADACRRLTEVAQRVGAVNTFWTEDGALVGDNTDVAGFAALVRHVMGEPAPRAPTVAVVGAGGGAAAVCAVVADWPGARIRLANRDLGKAYQLAARFPALIAIAPSPAVAARDADIVVNATPIGLTDDEYPVPLEALRRDAAVMDLAYREGETPWVRAARAAGHPAADGLEMLIAQGAHAFERWFGFPPDLTVMRAALAA